MSATQIHGNKQIQSATITEDRLVNLMVRADGTNPMSAALKMSPASPSAPAGNTNYIQNVTDPVNAQDAATRGWVLSQLGSAVTGSATARVASTANITKSGTMTIDGIALSVGNIVLLKNQTAAAENGLWVVASGAWTRATNMDSWAEVPGQIISVQEGTANHDTIWLSVADQGGTIDTTAITFTQIPGPSDITAGAGMTRTGQQIDVVAADSSLQINTDNMQVKLNASGCIVIVGANGIGVNFNSDSLLSLTNALNVKLDAAGAILAPAGGAGLKVNIDTNVLAITGNVLGFKANTVVKSNNIIWRAAVGGTIDGSNTTFVMPSAPNPLNTENVFLNGILQEPGAGNDYTISGLTITFAVAPPTGSKIKVTYTDITL